MNKTKQELINIWKEHFNFDDRLIEAFIKVKREDFIDGKLIEAAYEDAPLPIDEGQTISQPTTVMIMLDLLDIQEDDRILEIGCGSGYNAALMAEVAKKGKIISTDIIEPLAKKAQKRLQKYKNVEVFPIDGFKYAQKDGPFDKIIVTAAIKKVPDFLKEKLNEGGIILAPVGTIFSQEMILMRKNHGKIETEKHGAFMFVPVTGEYGF
jgi:protein-L-isoaspartate(D-aspartate) O-methyltransferase